jgi:ornithine cyclodeaminase/alanine dehydrogenase-like protein (mu-crystallin family)
MLLLTEDDIRRAVPLIDAVDVVRDGFRLHAERRSSLPQEAAIRWTTRSGASARCLVLPARLESAEPHQGVKIINASSSNLRRGLPRASGITCLFDDETSRIRCIASAGLLSALRTACVSALAIGLLAVSRIHKLCILGAGALARTHVELLLPRLSGLSEIAIFDIHPELASRLGERITELAADVRCVLMSTAEDAVRDAEVILTVTTATRAYLQWDWLSSGALIVNVSLDDLTSEVFARTDLLIVDDWALVAADRTRMLGRLIAEGVIGGPAADEAYHTRRVDGELGDLLVERAPGRRNQDDIVVFNPFGCGISDVALLAAVYEVAVDHHLGKQVALE